MVVPYSNGKEYFLFENRQPIGFDDGFILVEGILEIHGMAVYHVDETVLYRSFYGCNDAENWKEFRSEGWRKAQNGETHYVISLIQADDRWDLENFDWKKFEKLTLEEMGEELIESWLGDLYPGSLGITELSSYTKPNTSSYYFWGGSDPKFGYSGVTVTDIKETGGVVSANFSFVPFKNP
jgi:hypothetical protein